MKKLIGLVFIFILLFCLAPAAFAQNSLYAASVEGEIALYMSPSEASHKITTIPACSKLTLLEKERTWGLVEFNKKCGWVNMSFTRTSYTKAALATGYDAARKVKVNSENNSIDLYDVPSTDKLLGGDIKYSVVNDTILEIKRETRSGWGLVCINGDKYYWMQVENVEPYQESFDATQYGALEYVYVQSKGGKGVELWKDAERSSYHLIIPDCTRLTIREKKDGYAYVAYNGCNGWIDYSCTTESLANAQNNVGKAVNAEYTVSPESGSSTRMLDIPSDNPVDGATQLATIEEGTAVFVQRSTVTGWSLINHNGELGWVLSGDLIKSESTDVEITGLLQNPREGYVATEDCEGAQIYGTYNDEYEASIMPECVKVRVIAEKGDYEYIINDYAAGWIEKGNLVNTYAEALNAYKMDDDLSYVAEKDLTVMSMPTYNEKCESEEIAFIGKNTDFNVIKVVETNDCDWGLVEVSGVIGWIDLGGAERTEITIWDIVLVVGIVLGIVLLAFGVIFFLKWREKKKKETLESDTSAVKEKKDGKKKKSEKEDIKESEESKPDEKEVQENEKNVSDEGSQSCEEAADVSGK